MVVGSRLVRENKYTIHASWMLVLFAEVFYVAALALWGVRVLNARIDTNGAEISAGVYVERELMSLADVFISNETFTTCGEHITKRVLAKAE